MITRVHFAPAYHGPPEQDQRSPLAPQLHTITRKLTLSGEPPDRAAPHGAKVPHAQLMCPEAPMRGGDLASSGSRIRAGRGCRSRTAMCADDPEPSRARSSHFVMSTGAAQCSAPFAARGSEGAPN